MFRCSTDKRDDLWDQIDALSYKLTVAESDASKWRNAALILAAALDDPEQRAHAQRFIREVDGGR